jgi:hypothetical protein
MWAPHDLFVQSNSSGSYIIDFEDYEGIMTQNLEARWDDCYYRVWALQRRTSELMKKKVRRFGIGRL